MLIRIIYRKKICIIRITLIHHRIGPENKIMSLIKNIYRVVVPESIRRKVLDAKKKNLENELKYSILSYYKKNPSTDPEINEALDYLTGNNLSVFPYSFFNNYKNKPI